MSTSVGSINPAGATAYSLAAAPHVSVAQATHDR
jgi:hypothetical protein